MGKLGQVKHIWAFDGISLIEFVSDVTLDVFEQRHQVTLPADLRAYFKQLNGTGENYDSHMFQFYGLRDFKPIPLAYENWEGLTDYSRIVHTLKNPQQVYVFAHFSNHLYAYGIRLYASSASGQESGNIAGEIQNPIPQNEVYVICAGDYHLIADSFTRFIDLYLEDNEALYY